jgi:hypothetical protein
MRLLPALAAVCVLTCASGAAQAAPGAFAVEPKPGASQELTYRDGRSGVLSTQPHSSVILVLIQDKFALDDMPIFYLGVGNEGAAATNLTASNITATTDAGPVRVLTVGDLMLIEREEVNKKITSARWRAFGAALGSVGAAMGSSTGTFEATGSTFGETTTVQGTYTPPRDNSAAVRAYQNDITRALDDGERAAGTLPARYSRAEKYGFRPATIEAGKMAFSALPLDPLPKKATKLTVSVSVNGETHAFEYGLTYARQ